MISWRRLVIATLALLGGLCGCQDEPEETEGFPPGTPTDLRTTVHVGRMIVVMWNVPQPAAEWVAIEHGPVGEQAVVDTVPGRATSFTHAVGLEEGSFSYRVRAGNAYGVSAWSWSLRLNYELCSRGLLPLCVGHWWEYRVDTTGANYDLRREVAGLRLVNERDYYFLADSAVGTAGRDTLGLLRNNTDGVARFDWPPADTTLAQTLFRYDAQLRAGDYYHVRADCMLVLTGASGMQVVVGDNVFDGAVGYQRFYHDDPGRSTQYFVVPEYVGIIREDEYRGGARLARRDLVRWGVR